MACENDSIGFIRTCHLFFGIFSKCPQNKMAYEMIMVYHLHMPFFIAIFPCILT